MNRRRVALTTDTDADTDAHMARVTSTERLEALLETLWRFGPEPEGIVVSVNAAALEELPDGWTWERVGTDNGGAEVIAGP